MFMVEHGDLQNLTVNGADSGFYGSIQVKDGNIGTISVNDALRQAPGLNPFLADFMAGNILIGASGEMAPFPPASSVRGTESTRKLSRRSPSAYQLGSTRRAKSLPRPLCTRVSTLQPGAFKKSRRTAFSATLRRWAATSGTSCAGILMETSWLSATGPIPRRNIGGNIWSIGAARQIGSDGVPLLIQADNGIASINCGNIGNFVNIVLQMGGTIATDDAGIQSFQMGGGPLSIIDTGGQFLPLNVVFTYAVCSVTRNAFNLVAGNPTRGKRSRVITNLS